MALMNEKFLNKVVVDKTIQTVIDEELVWEKMLPKQSVNAPVVLYYKESYFHVESPNDAALSKTMDPKYRAPQYRGEGGTFPYMDVSGPTEYQLRLNQLALATRWTEEEMRYSEMENRVVKKTKGLALAFAGDTNTVLGNALTENWASSPSNIQHVDVGSGDEWSNGPTDTTTNPPTDIINGIEMLEDVAGYNYKANAFMLSKQSYFDLLNWVVGKNYEYHFQTPEAGKDVMTMLGLKIVPTNMVKRDFGIMADFNQCGIIYEAEPLATHPFFKDETREHHLQITRRFGFALTDPKAVVTFVNLVA